MHSAAKLQHHPDLVSQTTGQVDSVDVTEGGDILVSFKSRAAAEQGLAKGTNIPTVGVAQVSWYTGQPSSTSAPSKPSHAPADGAADSKESRAASPSHEEDTHMPDEEVVADGWGDADDEFGML